MRSAYDSHPSNNSKSHLRVRAGRNTVKGTGNANGTGHK
jgi:hypothetical protein